MPLTNAALSVTVKGDYSGSLALATLVSSLNQTRGEGFTSGSGTGAGQADKIYSATRTLAPSASETLALRAVLLDAFAVAISFFRLKGLLIYGNPANANNVLVGAAAANEWATWLSPAASGLITVRPGSGVAMFVGDADATGYAVASTDVLQVANSGAGTSVTYDIILIGCSA